MSSGKKTAEETFGERLRELRLQRGLSQEKLAELAGLHRNYVGHLERGEKSASLDVIVRLSHALEISVLELLQPFDKHTTSAAAVRSRREHE